MLKRKEAPNPVSYDPSLSAHIIARLRYSILENMHSMTWAAVTDTFYVVIVCRYYGTT